MELYLTLAQVRPSPRSKRLDLLHFVDQTGVRWEATAIRGHYAYADFPCYSLNELDYHHCWCTAGEHEPVPNYLKRRGCNRVTRRTTHVNHAWPKYDELAWGHDWLEKQIGHTQVQILQRVGHSMGRNVFTYEFITSSGEYWWLAADIEDWQSASAHTWVVDNPFAVLAMFRAIGGGFLRLATSQEMHRYWGDTWMYDVNLTVLREICHQDLPPNPLVPRPLTPPADGRRRRTLR